MKSPFKKLRGLGLNRHHKQPSPAQLDELSQASQDMHDMKDCYDSLLSSAAATANSAYEFSESLREMGDCLLEKTSLNDDEDSGRVLLMLGKVQFEIQKLVDNYRSHISRTITVPSESLLNELLVVEEMKRQCDEKRMWYDEMKIKRKERRSRSNKGEYVSSNQVRAAKEEFEEDATLFVFRMKSLKGGQSRSLLTQAARHHAAQMCFFRKALKSLETIEPHIQLVTKQHHIDYQFSGLEDDDRDSVFLTDDEDDEDESDDEQENGELSFDCKRNDPKNQVSSSENSMELESVDLTFPQVAPMNSVKEQRKPLWNLSTYNIAVNTSSKSAPLSARSNMDPSEKFRQMRQSSTRKLNTYVLPTPLDQNPRFNNTQQPASSINNNNMWHSSPLECKRHEEKGKFSAPILSSKNNSKPTPLPSPSRHQFSSFNDRKVKRYAFSGPIAATPHSLLSSGSLLNSGKLSSSFMSSPKISELHELPRPPANLSSNKPPPKGGFSAPLVTFKDSNVTIKSSDAASTLPVPLTAHHRI
ncbi:hypothetical protein L1987_11867 [Smallanthus sonchifolius]|uniref:Uncharacterized protein n=1 Tax=Smallanthus sonchifolius TaxID=185202 RepID=A0ACB9JEA1_9ASTR|nr:hypothetical protein L1987_11867 [Smallanthus sonchifolius]